MEIKNLFHIKNKKMFIVIPELISNLYCILYKLHWYTKSILLLKTIIR
jgi:hypothetical protein